MSPFPTAALWRCAVPGFLCAAPRSEVRQAISVSSLKGLFDAMLVILQHSHFSSPLEVERKEKRWAGKGSYSALEKRNFLCWGGSLLTLLAKAAIWATWEVARAGGTEAVSCHVSCGFHRGREGATGALTGWVICSISLCRPPPTLAPTVWQHTMSSFTCHSGS